MRSLLLLASLLPFAGCAAPPAHDEFTLAGKYIDCVTDHALPGAGASTETASALVARARQACSAEAASYRAVLVSRFDPDRGNHLFQAANRELTETTEHRITEMRTGAPPAR